MDRDECRGWRVPVKNSVERGVWQGPRSTWAKRGRWWLEGGCDTPGPSSIASYRSRHNVNIVANWRGVIVTEEGAHPSFRYLFPAYIHSRGDTRANLSGWSLERTLIVFVRAPRARYVHPLTSYSPPSSPPSRASVSPLGLFDGAPLN